MSNQSGLHYYSFGTLAENKPDGSFTIEVLPTEVFPFYDGELKEKKDIEKHSGVNAAGESYEVVVKTKKTIYANWWNFAGTHRTTAPDLRRGERVLIWQFTDEDEFFWDSLGLDDGLRRLEHVNWLFSDTTDESVTKLTGDNSYSVTVSTKQGLIEINTVDENGEAFTYTLNINTKASTTTMTDNKGNRWLIDSNAKRVLLENQSGSQVELIDDVINIISKKEINVKTTTFNLDASKTNFKGSVFDQKYGQTTTTGTIKNNGKSIDSKHIHLCAAPTNPSTPPNN